MMETLRPKAAANVIAIQLEKAGSLRWRAGHYLVIEGDVPRTMKPAELEANYDRAEGAESAAPVKRRRRQVATKPAKPGRKARALAPVKAIATLPAKGKRSSFSAEQMGEAKRLIQAGKSITETAKELDIPYAAVWRWSKANGWET